jgi:hypothetical protein
VLSRIFPLHSCHTCFLQVVNVCVSAPVLSNNNIGHGIILKLHVVAVYYV